MKNTHLLGLKDYPREDIQTIIDTGFRFKEIESVFSNDML